MSENVEKIGEAGMVHQQFFLCAKNHLYSYYREYRAVAIVNSLRTSKISLERELNCHRFVGNSI